VELVWAKTGVELPGLRKMCLAGGDIRW
jgi:hypothetical protein